MMKLSTSDADLFYALFWSLLVYANQHLKIIPELGTTDDVPRTPFERLIELRNGLYAQPALLERFLDENPRGFSQDELAIVAGWRHRVAGDFYVFRHLKAYTVFLSAAEPSHLYGVLGLQSSLDEAMPSHALPLHVKGVLLPFKDKIIYDSFLNVYNIHFGSGIRSSLNDLYRRLKAQEGIIEQLLGPEGAPEPVTSQKRKAPRKAAPDWRPAVDEIVASTERMRQAGTLLQSAALTLLRAAASLAQGLLSTPEDLEERRRRLAQVRRALTRLERLQLEEDWYDSD